MTVYPWAAIGEKPNNVVGRAARRQSADASLGQRADAGRSPSGRAIMMKRTEATFAIPRCWTWLVLPALLLSVGCGGPKGAISGRVTYLDKPLPRGGTITFFGPENRVVGTSVISSDGTYSMVKVPAGPATITVTAPITIIKDPNAPKLPPVSTEKGGKQKALIKRSREQKQSGIRWALPDKYSMPEQSGLTYTVQPGSQEYNIDLK